MTVDTLIVGFVCASGIGGVIFSLVLRFTRPHFQSLTGITGPVIHESADADRAVIEPAEFVVG